MLSTHSFTYIKANKDCWYYYTTTNNNQEINHTILIHISLKRIAYHTHILKSKRTKNRQGCTFYFLSSISYGQLILLTNVSSIYHYMKTVIYKLTLSETKQSFSKNKEKQPAGSQLLKVKEKRPKKEKKKKRGLSLEETSMKAQF